MSLLVLVRHGETVWHAENRYAGRSDVALTPRGREQAELLARWAARAGLSAIWCSSLGRARETAAAVGRATGLEPRVDPRLVELDFGRCEGLTRAEIGERFPDALRRFQEDPVAHHLPEGEEPRRAVERGVACLEDVARAHAGGRVLVVAHSTLIRLVLCHLIGVPVSGYRRLFPSVSNGAITEVRLDREGAALMRYNAPLGASGP